MWLFSPDHRQEYSFAWGRVVGSLSKRKLSSIHQPPTSSKPSWVLRHICVLGMSVQNVFFCFVCLIDLAVLGLSFDTQDLWPLCRCAGSLVTARGVFLVVTCVIFSCSTGTLSCGMWDLVPWPGIEAGPPALGAWSLSPWTTREVTFSLLWFSTFSLPDLLPLTDLLCSGVLGSETFLLLALYLGLPWWLRW